MILSILKYNSTSNTIEVLTDFSSAYPGIDIYSPNFKDKFQEYINNIVSELNTVIGSIKDDVCSSPKLVLTEGTTINFSDVFKIENLEGLNVVTFLEDVKAENVTSETANFTELNSSEVIADIGKIGDITLDSSGIKISGSNISSNEEDGSSRIGNLTIENNLIIKGAVKSFIPEDNKDFYYDFGFMTVSRVSGEVTIEFDKDSGFVLGGSAYIGEVRTKENQVLTQQYISDLESKIEKLYSLISSKVSEFWNDVNINDFIAKALVNSKNFYGNFNNDSFKCVFETEETLIQSLVLDLSNSPVNSEIKVSKILAIDSMGVNYMYGPGYDDTVIEVVDKKITIPTAIFSSSQIKEIWIKTVISDTSSNKATGASFIIKAGD